MYSFGAQTAYDMLRATAACTLRGRAAEDHVRRTGAARGRPTPFLRTDSCQSPCGLAVDQPGAVLVRAMELFDDIGRVPGRSAQSEVPRAQRGRQRGG
jgi:hypothetical protein